VQLGSCPNAFEGCISNVNCPWSANVVTSKCDSSATVAAGVYSIYLTAKECCESHFYWDIDACLASPPTPPPTVRPSVVEQQTPIDNIVGPQQSKPPPDGDTVGILLAPIYIRFSNMQSQLQLDEEDREQLQDIIRRSLLVESDEFNITIADVDAVDSIFSNEDDQTISMSMYLKITITGEDVDPREVQIAFTNALQDQIYLIDNEINKSWGTASNNMVLGIGNVKAGGDIVSTRISNESSSSVPVWGIILIILLFAFLCGGLLVLQRRRLDKGDSLPRHTHINESYFDREKSQPCGEGRYNPGDRQHISKRNQQHASNQSQQTLTSRGREGDEIIVPHNKPDPDGEKSFNKSMSFTQSALNINEEPIEQSPKRIEGIQRKRSSGGGMRRESSQEHDIQINRSLEHEHMARGQEELEEEDGYDGGRSSFFITNDNYDVQESSDDSSEENNSSDDDVGVLGLMYYDGASSAGESLGAKESRLSRRSKRSAARSKKSTKSKASSRVSQSQQQPPPIARKKEATKHKVQHQNTTADGQKDYPYVLQPPYNKRQSDHSDNIYIGGESSVVSGLSSNAEEFNHYDNTRTKVNKSSTILEELD